eukprot:91511-Heterocapsa_arctica.AAC.1
MFTYDARHTQLFSAVGAADADAVVSASSGGRPRLTQSDFSFCIGSSWRVAPAGTSDAASVATQGAPRPAPLWDQTSGGTGLPTHRTNSSYSSRTSRRPF